MKEQIEIEYKILITQDIFQQMINNNQVERDYIQTNYYFTHPILQAKKYMLRIREKDNTYELTLKRPYLTHQLETNIIIDKQTKDKLISHQYINNEIIDILQKEGINPLELVQQFSLTTHRYDIQLNEGTLSLDHNQYLGKEDYELEFEVYHEKEGYEKFLEIISAYQLQYTNNCKSKIKRVLDSL
ncbi:MAG: CYTH domain-containing protein [Coprobacillus sp.]